MVSAKLTLVIPLLVLIILSTAEARATPIQPLHEATVQEDCGKLNKWCRESGHYGYWSCLGLYIDCVIHPAEEKVTQQELGYGVAAIQENCVQLNNWCRESGFYNYWFCLNLYVHCVIH